MMLPRIIGLGILFLLSYLFYQFTKQYMEVDV